LIPVLITRAEATPSAGARYRTLEIVLVDKQNGELSEPFSISAHFGDRAGACAAYVVATPSRIIVQANGMVAAFGAFMLRAEP
jgi:hypothetical protein